MERDDANGTVVGALLRWADREPERIAFRVLDRRGEEVEALCYRDLARRAAGAARRIEAHTPPGAMLLLALPTGSAFVAGLFGGLLAGRTVIPAPPPARRDRARFMRLLENSEASCAVLPSDHPAVRELAAAGIAALDLSDAPVANPEFKPPAATDPAILQYSSGSTREPTGVPISHRAIVANSAMITAVFGHDAGTQFVNWLPLFHDMGLVGGVLQPVMTGSTCTLISAADFAARPRLWLEAVSRFRAHTSGGPDSAYGLCVQAISQTDLAGLDLSSWRAAFNGSERVHSRTLADFSGRFAGCGFDPSAFLPCYGLAEATLLVSGAHWQPAKEAPRFDRARLSEGEAAASAQGLEIVPLGPPAPGLDLTIVDPAGGDPLPEGRIGEIVVRGASIAPGYYGAKPRPPASGHPTGDLGFLRHGVLYIVARKDDLIIQFGRNLFPDDLEVSAERLTAQRGCRVAAVDIEGCLVLAVEVRKMPPDGPAALASALARRLAEIDGARVDRVIYLRPGAIPRTSSGKVRRQLTARLLHRGELAPLAVVDPMKTASSSAVEVVAAILGMSSDAVDPQASLAALGCQSIQAWEIVRVLASNHGIVIPPEPFLTDLTIAELVMLTRSGIQADGPAIDRPDPRLLLLSQYAAAGDTAPLNLAFVARAHGAGAGDRLRAAADTVLARHPALRCSPVLGDGDSVRLVRRPIPVVERLVGPPRDVEAQSLVPFFLEREPPCRVTVHDEGGAATLLMVIHHAAADLASMETLVRELSAEWEDPGCLQRLPTPAKRDRAMIPAGAAAYWDERFGTLPGRLLGPRSHGMGKVLRFEVSEDLRTRLGRRAALFGVTEFQLSVAAFARAVATVFRRERVALVTPLSLRNADDLDTVGYAVLPVPLIVDAGASTEARDLIDEVRNQLRQAVVNGGLPAAATLASPAALATLAFEFAFLWQQGSDRSRDSLIRLALPHEETEVSIGGLAFARPQQRASPYHAVELTVVPHGDRLSAALVYDPATMDEAVAEAMVEAWTRALVDEPCAETVQRDAAVPRSSDGLHDLFVRWVAKTPDAPALDCGGETFSYRALGAAAANVARRCRGARRVAVLCGEGPSGVAALLGVAMAGAAFLALRPDDPPLRIKTILMDASVDLVLIDAEGAAAGVADLCAVPIVEVGFDPSCSEGDFAPVGATAAYIAFTSGSTGRPNGVVHTHRTIVDFLGWQAKVLGMGPRARMAVLAPMGFDVRYCELFGALCFGGCAVLSRPGDRLPDALGDFLVASRVTAVQMLPSAFSRSPPRRFPDLRALFFVGEILPPALVARAFEQCGGSVEISNVYGPTEVVAATWRRLVPSDADAERIPVGTAIPGRIVHIVDDAMKKRRPGEVGEILIESDVLGDGYLGDAGNLGEVVRFLPPGAVSGVAGRSFRTGDLGLIDATGRLFVLGRRDNQIKVHGLRFETEEIELALTEETDAPAAVLAHPNGQSPRIEAFLEIAAIDGASLRRRLLRRLPVSVIPTAFTAVAKLPRLSNGKLDRMAVASLAGAAADQPPLLRTPQADLVSAAWQGSLGAAPAGAFDNFFAAGGHSLLAMQMLNRLAGGGVPLRLAEFLGDPTPARLLAMLEERAHRPPISPIAAASSEGESPVDPS